MDLGPGHSSIAVVVVGRHTDRPGSGTRQSALAFSMLLQQVFFLKSGCDVLHEFYDEVLAG